MATQGWCAASGGGRKYQTGLQGQSFSSTCAIVDNQAAVANFSADRGGSKRPRMSSESSPSLLDLLMDVLKLYKQDPLFALASTSGGDAKVGDNIDQIIPLISTLLVGSGSDALKLHAKSALLAVLEEVRDEIGVEANSQINTSNMWPAMYVSRLLAYHVSIC